MKRGQAAMEFLSTYGWAIMVVLVMIGALSYFGVTNPKNLVPERCLFQQQFACDDFAAFLDPGTEGNVTFFLSNNAGVPVQLNGFTATHMDSNYLSDPCALPADTIISSGEAFQISCIFPDDTIFAGVGELERFSVNGSYTEIGGRYPHIISGEIAARLQ